MAIIISMEQKKLVKRILMTLVGQVILGVGAGCLRAAGLGIDPYQCFTRAVETVSPLSYGTTFVIINAVFLILMFIFARSYIGISTVFNMFLLGYIIDWSASGISSLIPSPGIVVQVLLLLAALVLICFSSALIFTSDLGVSTYDWIALHLSDIQKKIAFRWLRIMTDVLCVIIGLCFGIVPGVGTLITALALGPVISFFRTSVTDPFLYGKRTAAEKK